MVLKPIALSLTEPWAPRDARRVLSRFWEGCWVLWRAIALSHVFYQLVSGLFPEATLSHSHYCAWGGGGAGEEEGKVRTYISNAFVWGQCQGRGISKLRDVFLRFSFNTWQS